MLGCPFCGEVPTLTRKGKGPNEKWKMLHWCSNILLGGSWVSDLDGLVKRWNRRSNCQPVLAKPDKPGMWWFRHEGFPDWKVVKVTEEGSTGLWASACEASWAYWVSGIQNRVPGEWIFVERPLDVECAKPKK